MITETLIIDENPWNYIQTNICYIIPCYYVCMSGSIHKINLVVWGPDCSRSASGPSFVIINFVKLINFQNQTIIKPLNTSLLSSTWNNSMYKEFVCELLLNKLLVMWLFSVTILNNSFVLKKSTSTHSTTPYVIYMLLIVFKKQR